MMLLTRVYMMNWLKIKNDNSIDSGLKHLEKKIEDVDKKTADTSKFILTQEFNRLTKINLNTRMKEASKRMKKFCD